MEPDAGIVSEMVDKAENFLQYGNIEGSPLATLPADMRIDALTNGLMEIRDALRAEYISLAGSDPWDGDISWAKKAVTA